MGNLSTAWRSQVVLEEALSSRMLGRCADYLPGDSMLVLNKYGKRCLNEKRDYNDRTNAHFVYDPTREEYPNQLMLMIFDERSRDSFAGSYPFTVDKREMPGLIEGASLDQLFEGIEQHLADVADRTGGVRLADDFRQQALASIKRFNGYARLGKDPDFERGLHNYDREWHLLFSARRDGTDYPPNPMPNITMHPMAEKGPFYCLILAAGALDTNGGPLIDHRARVLDHLMQPIPGLYGAGNCIASPSRDAYYGAGCTIGLALTYGYIAAIDALS